MTVVGVYSRWILLIFVIGFAIFAFFEITWLIIQFALPNKCVGCLKTTMGLKPNEFLVNLANPYGIKGGQTAYMRMKSGAPEKRRGNPMLTRKASRSS